MGVSCILLWEPPEGLNAGQALDFLQNRLEILGGRSQGAWSVDCETLQSVPNLSGAAGGQKLVYLLHSSEYPRTTFLVLDNSLLCLVAENTLDTIFVHLKQFYAPRKQPRIEVMGKFYFVKQYMVKFGAISIGSTNRGIVVEVEDQESTRVGQCWNELTAFTKGLLHSSHTMDVPIFARQSDRPYVPSDSMIHYAFIFGQLRKTPTATGAIK